MYSLKRPHFSQTDVYEGDKKENMHEESRHRQWDQKEKYFIANMSVLFLLVVFSTSLCLIDSRTSRGRLRFTCYTCCPHPIVQPRG